MSETVRSYSFEENEIKVTIFSNRTLKIKTNGRTITIPGHRICELYQAYKRLPK